MLKMTKHQNWHKRYLSNFQVWPFVAWSNHCISREVHKAGRCLCLSYQSSTTLCTGCKSQA